MRRSSVGSRGNSSRGAAGHIWRGSSIRNHKTWAGDTSWIRARRVGGEARRRSPNGMKSRGRWDLGASSTAIFIAVPTAHGCESVLSSFHTGSSYSCLDSRLRSTLCERDSGPAVVRAGAGRAGASHVGMTCEPAPSVARSVARRCPPILCASADIGAVGDMPLTTREAPVATRPRGCFAGATAKLSAPMRRPHHARWGDTPRPMREWCRRPTGLTLVYWRSQFRSAASVPGPGHHRRSSRRVSRWDSSPRWNGRPAGSARRPPPRQMADR